MDSVILALVFAAGAYLAWEFGRQLYDAGMHGTIRTGRGNRRVVRRELDPELFRNNLIVAIVLFGVFCAGAVSVFLTLLGAI